MAYFNTCPHCGSNLDPGEPCDCRRGEEKEDTNRTTITEGKTYGERFTGAAISQNKDRTARVG